MRIGALLINVNSGLTIREAASMGEVDIPISLSINAVNTKSSIRNGRYRKNPNTRFDFIKENGSMVLNGIYFYIEMISVGVGTNYYPIILRLWGKTSICKEFLVTKNIEIFRKSILNMHHPSSTLIAKICTIVGDENMDDDLDMVDYQALGFTADKLPIIPNLTQKEYNQLNYLSLFTQQRCTDVINILFNTLYFEGMTPSDLINLTTGIEQPNFIKRCYQYQHQADFDIDASSIFMTVLDVNILDSMIILKRIPYDSFNIDIFLKEYDIVINSIDTSSGPLYPFDFNMVYNEIVNILNEFVMTFLYCETCVSVLSNQESMVYLDDNTKIVIDSLNIIRTNDEIVTITFKSGDYIYSRSYDLIMLVMLTPILGE